MLLIAMAAAALAALLALVAVRLARERRLARIRAAWGKPVHRTRRMDAIAASHRSRLARANPVSSLDDRTWTDLDLDAVFAAIDRTQSTLGQHALYHRLRTSPAAGHLAGFEALVAHMERDAAARERALLALDRLQDPQGYDIWWLGGPDAAGPGFMSFLRRRTTSNWSSLRQPDTSRITSAILLARPACCSITVSSTDLRPAGTRLRCCSCTAHPTP